jgi:apolipoprotein N-acyltransferase
MFLVFSAGSAREAISRVWLGGVGYFIAVHHWLIPVTGPFVIPLAAFLATLWILWGWLGWRILGQRRSLPRLVAAFVVVPSAWVAAEYIRAWGQLGGPWGLLGATQWANRQLLGVVSIGGVWLMSYVLVAINVAVTSMLAPAVSKRERVVAASVGAGLLLAAVAVPSMLPVSEGGVFRVAGVQTGIVHGGAERIAAHEELTRSLIGEDLDLIVWAESSVGVDLTPGAPRTDRLADLSRAVSAPILVNIDARAADGGIYKASMLIDHDGIQDRYDKMRLVPFGEYVPLRSVLGWVTRVTDAADEDRRRGEELVMMQVGDVAIGPLVCFESAFPDLSRSLVDRGADVVVLQTATTTFQGSWAQAQHASLAAVRAVETRRPVVHAALSGDSAVFAADGSRITWLGNQSIGTWRAEIPLATGTTPYVRSGDWVPVLSVLVVAVAIALPVLQWILGVRTRHGGAHRETSQR